MLLPAERRYPRSKVGLTRQTRLMSRPISMISLLADG
jgi:hypothetical protein